MFLLSRLTEIYLRFSFFCFGTLLKFEYVHVFHARQNEKVQREIVFVSEMFMNPFQQIFRMLFHKNILLTNVDTNYIHSYSGEGWSWILFSCLGFLWRSESEMLKENASQKWSTASSFIMNCENIFLLLWYGKLWKGKIDFFQFHSALLLLQFSAFRERVVKINVCCFSSVCWDEEKRREASSFNAFSRNFEGTRCLCFGILERVIYSWTVWHRSRAPELGVKMINNEVDASLKRWINENYRLELFIRCKSFHVSPVNYR